jgi:hypothetical protein
VSRASGDIATPFQSDQLASAFHNKHIDLGEGCEPIIIKQKKETRSPLGCLVLQQVADLLVVSNCDWLAVISLGAVAVLNLVVLILLLHVLLIVSALESTNQRPFPLYTVVDREQILHCDHPLHSRPVVILRVHSAAFSYGW